MQPHSPNRRTFLRQSLALASTALWFKPAVAFCKEDRKETAPVHFIRLGGPSFTKTEDPEELALAHRQMGYRAAYCPKVPLQDSDRIRAFRDAFAKHDVVIAEVGRWVNLLDADADKRRANLQTVTEGLALAEAMGARCCVDLAGSFSPIPGVGPNPENLSQPFFDAAVENARKIIDAVKPQHAKFCYEVKGWALPDSPEHYIRMLKAIDRPAFGVHLDPCNLVNSPDKFFHNPTLLNECFDQLGSWIVSCHAKDLVWDVEMAMHFREVAPGKGVMDYTTYLQRVARLPQCPPVMLEHLPTAEDYTGARNYLFEVGRRAGLSFG